MAESNRDRRLVYIKAADLELWRCRPIETAGFRGTAGRVASALPPGICFCRTSGVWAPME